MNGNEPKNFIEINGNKYDAITGRLIEPANTAGAEKPASKPGVIDGFVRRPGAIYKPTIIEKSAKSSANTPKSQRKTTNISRNPQKATTLMRPTVKKPKHSAPERSAKNTKAPKVNPNVPHARLKRAEQIKKSDRIVRFKPVHSKSTIVKKMLPLPVASRAHREPAPKEDLSAQLERAVENATSHLEEFVANSKGANSKKRFALATITLSVLFASGVLLYQAVPMAKVKVAGTKAGFSASLPSYSPAGFGLDGSVKASSGEVNLNYKSRTDNKGYRITQSPSGWNSQSLVTNFLTPAGKTFQTYENNGTTIYVYDGSNATWVDGGIWYVLEGDANLTSDQLIRIANGL
ncbi:hypothetical protein HZB74_03080 [Candidatus Saccharibacteria bacterium]|nr:hypothetical protein [Candidatus Saccharibacteria bacterium]